MGQAEVVQKQAKVEGWRLGYLESTLKQDGLANTCLKVGKVRLGQIRQGWARLMLDQARLGQIKLDQTRLGQIKARLGKVGLD